MRINIELDDDLITTAIKLSGFKTKKKVIEEGLKLLITLNNQKKFRDFRGKLNLSRNLVKLRKDKSQVT